MSNKLSKAQYYSVSMDKSLNLFMDAVRCTKMFSSSTKTLVEKYDTESWDSSPISDYMDAYLNSKVLKDFLERKLKDTDEQMAKYAIKNKIDGIILTKNELVMLQSIIQNFEETKEYMHKNYGFSTVLN